MSDSFLDRLPSNERRRLRKMMSPEAYERMREKVKGPEDLEKELKKSERMAELSFELQTDEKLREKLKSAAESDIREHGVDAVLDADNLPSNVRKALEQGKFALAVAGNPSTHEDQLVAVPEGSIKEKIPLRTAFNDRYVTQLSQKK